MARQYDWESIERDYRAGVLSVREISSKHGPSHTAINKRAKKEQWERDLKAKIKAKADALVSKSEVSTEVSTETLETERVLIESNAKAIADVRLNHRKDIRRYRNLAGKLLDELEATTDSLDLFEKLGELLRDEDENGMDKRNDLYQRVIGLPSRSKVMKEMSDTLKTLLMLERQAYDLDNAADRTDSPASFKAVDPIEAAKAYQDLMEG